MEKFGDVMSEPMDILDRECPDIATGDISIIMKLHKQIPSFLPMYGKKIRVAYRGMTTVCSNCYDVGHMRIGCENQRANYLDYVFMLMQTERFDRTMFGNWATRAEKFKSYKEDQINAKRNQRSKTTYETIDEETYIDQRDEDELSTSSYKSTGTVVDDFSNDQNDEDPAFAQINEKISSFESRKNPNK